MGHLEISDDWKQLPLLDLTNRMVKDPSEVIGGNQRSVGAVNEGLYCRKHGGLIGSDLGI